MSTQLFRKDDHLCIALSDHACGGCGMQATRFLVLDGAASALIVSGTALPFAELRRAVSPYIHPDDLELVVCALPVDEHARLFAPWLERTCVSIVGGRRREGGAASAHAAPERHGRFIFLPDAGADIPLCERTLTALPVGRSRGAGVFRFFDPFSRLLFDCDSGVRFDASSREVA